MSKKEFKGPKRQGGWVQLAAAAVGAIAGYLANKQSNDANIDQTQEARDWMERMSNTSYQRGIADMKAAGLNPMLAYSQGGASTPQTSAPIMQSKIGGAISGASQGMQVAQAVQSIDTGNAQASQMRAQAEKTQSETFAKDLTTARYLAETGYTGSLDKLTKLDQLKREEEIVSAREGARQSQIKTEVDRKSQMYDITRRHGESREAEGRGNVQHLLGRKSQAISDTVDKASPYLRDLIDNARGAGSSAWEKYQDWRNGNRR